jgi:hypothetical protein
LTKEVVDMSESRSPSWILAATRRRGSYADLRISDAERAEVADMLATHYEDGRLDAAEFHQRLDQAMRARTYKDLNGLFTDLPVTGGSGGPEVPEVRAGRSPGTLGPRSHRLLLIVLIVAIAAVAGRALAWSLTPWAWIGLLCVIILLAVRGPKGTS